MSSKRRLRKNACIGKIRHRNEVGALIHIRLLVKRGLNEFYAPYKCRFCGWWHVGRPPQK